MSPKVRSAIFKAPTYPLKRRRTKKLHRELLDQLEFYMSEANIRHDAFMREKTGEQGTEAVPINLFLSFPLIQEMKVTEKNLIKAIEKSVTLELSDDKLNIRRRYPVNGPPQNLDDSTLYIENLPADSTTEWLKEVCLKTGTVRHISLPRYKKSGQIKGFAFVEYASPEDVARACRIFRDPPINFYPSRTGHYLARMKRIERSKNGMPNDADSNASTQVVQHEDSVISVREEILPDSRSKSLVESRKRKRSRGILVDATTTDEEELHNFHENGRVKKSRNDDLDTKSEESTSAAASVSRKHKSVMFAVNHDNTHDNFSNFAECNGDASLQSECISEKSKATHTKTTVNQQSSQKCQQTDTWIGNMNIVPNSRKLLPQVNSISGFKRRRSISEPPASSDDDALLPKRQKDETDCAAPLFVSPTSDGINAMIIQARHAVGLEAPYLSPTKPIMQSVVLKSSTQPRKPRRSKTSRERKRLRAGRIPPNLSVLPKVEWLEFKKEYKKLQKQNMSKLKRTIRENKDAGSVFIKKHLDVLHDVRTSSTSACNSQGNDATECSDIKEHSFLKRGAPRFQPGVIAKISSIHSSDSNSEGDSHHHLPSIEEIKATLNQYGQGVAYVDVNAGNPNGYVRFNDGESAQRAILEEKSLALCLLTGEQEEQYWDKLLASRARKFSQERKKIRGRTKILSKADMLVEKGKRKHIRFDNDFLSV